MSERVDKAVEMYVKGFNVKQICDMHMMEQGQLYAELKKRGIQLRYINRPKPNVRKIRCRTCGRLIPEWYSKLGTKSDTQIAKEYNIRRETVVRWRNELNVPKFIISKSWKDEVRTLLKLYPDKSLQSIAKDVGKSYQSVYKFVRNMNND